MSSAANLYQSVINDVITSVRESFLDESVDENVLLELKNLWVQVMHSYRVRITETILTRHWFQKLEASKATEPAHVSDASALDSKMVARQGAFGQRGGAATSQQQLVISDPNR